MVDLLAGSWLGLWEQVHEKSQSATNAVRLFFLLFNCFKSLTKKVKCISELGAKCHCLVCA